MAIWPEALRQMLAWDEKTLSLRQSAMLGDEPATDAPPKLDVRNGIAIIKIQGPLSRRDDFWSWLFGGCSYDSIREQLQLAREDAGVKAILLDVDSPGGDANGCSELADLIFAMRGARPIWAYVGGLGCSAAYWISSSADHIVCDETALLGSIGVRSAVVDYSEAEKKWGVRTTEIISSQSPGKRDTPVDDEVIAKCQRTCDDLAEVFIAKVARGRGVDTSTVEKDFGQGDVLIGQHAVDAGLADEIGSFESVLIEMSASQLAPTPGDRTMKNKTALTAAPAFKAEDKKDDNKEDKKDAKKAKAEGEEEAEDDVDAEADDADKKDAKKAEGEEETDAEDDEEKEAEEEDDKEAKSALAQMAGLKASASLGKIAAALQARTVPLPQLAALQRKNAELSAAVTKLQDKDIAASAETFVDTAISEGRTVADKRDHLVAEFGKAERAKAGGGAAALEPNLFAKGTFTIGRQISNGKGGIKGKKEVAQSFAQDSPDSIVAAFSKKANEIAKNDKVPFAVAMGRVKDADPELYAAYAALRQ